MSGNELLTDDELAAAFAEIEASAGDDSIPDLDDGSGAASADAAASMVAVVNTTEPEFEAQPAEGVDEFATNENASLIDDEFASPEALAALEAAAAGDEQPTKRFQFDFKAIIGQVHDRCYDAVDTTLHFVNRPFARLDTKARKLVVLGSAVTIGFSILVIVLAPLLIRGKTPMEFLHEKSSSLKVAVSSVEDDDS